MTTHRPKCASLPESPIWRLAALSAFGLVAACQGGAPSASTGVDDPAPAASPADVPIDVARTTTDGHVAVQNLDATIEELQRLVAERGGDARLERVLAERLQQRAAYTGSYDDFAEIDALTAADIARDPGDPVAWQGRASFLGAVHRFVEARDALATAEAAGASPGAIARARWVIDLAEGAAPEALVEQAALRLAESPSFQTRADYGTALAHAGRFEEADAAYVDAVARYRDVAPFPVAWVAFQRGVMWAERADRPDLAVPLYREAVRRLPRYVVANVHLAELEAAGAERPRALARLEALAGVGDPEPDGLLAELLAPEAPDVAGPLRDRARARYEVLLARHREAFLDHGSEFFSGPGGDPARGLALALENLALRRDARAYKVAIEAAVAQGDLALACRLAAEAEPLRARHPVLDGVVVATCG